MWQIASAGGSGNTNTVPLQTTNNATYGNPQIQKFKVGKSSPITSILIPTKDSSSTISLDVGGTVRNITIEGLVVGTITQLNNFIGDIEDKLYGKQFTNTNKGHTLTVELAKVGVTTYNVMIKDFDYEWDAGNPNQVSYTMGLIQVSST